MKSVFALAALSLFVGACAEGAEETDAEVDNQRQAIGWGKLVPATGHGAPDTSVVKLEISQSGGARLCSGIKVESNTFWTAGSCIERVVPGDQVRVTNNLEGDFSRPASYTVAVASADVHPSRKNYSKNGQTGPRHFDVGRLVLAASTPDIPSYSRAPSGLPVEAFETVTYTAYGDDPEHPNFSGKKQYQFFRVVNGVQGYDPETMRGIFNRHIVVDNRQKPYSSMHDDGAAVFKGSGTNWDIVGLVPQEDRNSTFFVRMRDVAAWLASPAVNRFEAGFQGSIFNKLTGRCIAHFLSDYPNEFVRESEYYRYDHKTWTLFASSQAGSFYIADTLDANESGGTCLETVFGSLGYALRTGRCTGIAAQRWTFAVRNDPDYREINNGLAPGCLQASSTGQLSMGQCGTTTGYESWVMTR